MHILKSFIKFFINLCYTMKSYVCEWFSCFEQSFHIFAKEKRVIVYGFCIIVCIIVCMCCAESVNECHLRHCSLTLTAYSIECINTKAINYNAFLFCKNMKTLFKTRKPFAKIRHHCSRSVFSFEKDCNNNNDLHKMFRIMI